MKLIALLFATAVACGGSPRAPESAPAPAPAPEPETAPAPEPALPAAFAASLAANGMTFTPPDGWTAVAPVDNPHFLYTHAIATDGLELRIRVDSLAQVKKDHERCATDPSCTAVDPNVLPASVHMATSMNIGTRVLHSEEATAELLAAVNADSGQVSFALPRETFATGFERAIVMVLAKRDTAYVTVIALVRDNKVDPNKLQAVGALRFK